ncbi:MAG TPA: SDR family oxidoreductase [Candidatus Nanoarchaeia archaeon]|nr:SDR family oxidoreductase [Candidatus Nanoarchaeia archaeon]
MKLKDKVIVITGAGKGLGKELAVMFAKEEAKVVISSRTKKNIKDVAKETNAYPIISDVRDEKQVKKLAERTIKKFKKIDIWINNAGVRIPHNNVEETDWKRAHDMMEINLFGTIYGSKEAIIQMKKQKSGVIINILSTSALEGRANLSAYAASKFAVVGFTQSLRAEAKPYNISVISVYPGGMRTEFFREQIPSDYEQYQDPRIVAEGIINNLKNDKIEEELILRRK